MPNDQEIVQWNENILTSKINRKDYKKLGEERIAIVFWELDRLQYPRDDFEKRLHEISFLKDKILIGDTPREYENMKGWRGIFIPKTNSRYYNWEEAKHTGEQQWLTLPTLSRFTDSVTSILDCRLATRMNRGKKTIGGHVLSILLWEGLLGSCDLQWRLVNYGESGVLGTLTSWGRICPGTRYYMVTTKDTGQVPLVSEWDRVIYRPLAK